MKSFGEVLFHAGRPLRRNLTYPDTQKQKPAQIFEQVPKHSPFASKISKFFLSLFNQTIKTQLFQYIPSVIRACLWSELPKLKLFIFLVGICGEQKAKIQTLSPQEGLLHNDGRMFCWCYLQNGHNAASRE